MLGARISREEHVSFETENVTDKDLQQRFLGGKSRAQPIKQSTLSLVKTKMNTKK